MFMVLKMIFNSHKADDSNSPDSVTLSELNQGDTAMLGELDLAPQVADHLMNLGFIPGTEVTVAQSGPGGDPRIYRVDRTEVALRRNLSERITVQLLPAKKPVLSVALGEAALALQAGDASAD
jgi:ferrous iron transport protein A